MLVTVWGKGVSIFFHTPKGCPLDNMKTKKGKALLTQRGTTMTIQGQGRAKREGERERVMLVTELHFLKSVSTFPSVLLSMKVAKSLPPHKLQKKFTYHVYVYIYVIHASRICIYIKTSNLSSSVKIFREILGCSRTPFCIIHASHINFGINHASPMNLLPPSSKSYLL